MGLFKKVLNQTRKPEGFLGKLMVGGMNGGHARLADWGMSHLNGITASNIAELGCGGGRNAGELLKLYPKAKLTALDYSALSVEKTKAFNKTMLAAGRCEVLQGNVTSLPFETETFDLATAFETVYFWPELEQCFAEVRRVLKPGSTFLICNESDGTDKTAQKYEKIIDGMKCYTAEQLTAALQAAGFSEIKTDHHAGRPWLTVVARK
ncbi:MAG: class I SAM-dependent methyltransferase [Oscillospiraceae bacterium]|nr:class I SAM-dependent methyltransferase [Oscillospiraceae bacterium]